MRVGVLVALVVALCLGLIVRSAAAQPGGMGPTPKHFPHAPPTPPPSPKGPGKIRLTTEDGERGPVVLAAKNGGFFGSFTVSNDGDGPLTVSRVAMRSDDDDPRLPPRFTARFADGGGGSSVISPHSAKKVNITWTPDREPKLSQALGHVVLTSNDEAAGEVAMGFVAPMAGELSFVTAHLLSWMLLLPLLGAVVLGVMFIIGHEADARVRSGALFLGAIEAVLALTLYQGFRGTLVRADGDDGMQFVERTVLSHGSGIEYFVGVDGVSIALVLLTVGVALAFILASQGVQAKDVHGGLRAYYALFAVTAFGAMGVFVSLDLALFWLFWVVMLVGLAGLVAVTGPRLRRHATVKLAVYGGVSALLLCVGVTLLHLQSDSTFLADGTRTAHSFAVPELMRVAYNAKHLEIVGCSWVKIVWVVLFLAFAALIPVVPLHGWLVDLAHEVPAPVGVLLTGVVLPTGLYGVLRVMIEILPDGSRWAAVTLVALGAVNVVFGAVSALRQTDLGRLVAYASIVQMGYGLMGVGAMCREGIAACLVGLVSHGVVVPLLFLVGVAVRDRTGTRDLTAMGGLARKAPRLALLVGVAFFAASGAPGLPVFWGEAMAVVSAFPVTRSLATVAMAGAVGVATAFVRAFVRVGWGDASGAPKEEANGGSAPPLRDVAALTLLVVVAVAIGLDPAPVFRLTRAGVSDLNLLVNPPGPDEIAGLIPARRESGRVVAIRDDVAPSIALFPAPCERHEPCDAPLQ
jgi:NADH-quinone oxidoreductase subunit M